MGKRVRYKIMKMKNIKNELPIEDGKYLIRENIDGRIYFFLYGFAKNPYVKIDKYEFDKTDRNIFYYNNYKTGGYFKVDLENITHWLNVKDIEIEE